MPVPGQQFQGGPLDGGANYLPGPPVTPKGKGRLPLYLIGGAVLLIAAVAGVLLFTGVIGQHKQDLTIKFELIELENGGSCSTGGTDGYSDISPGMPFTVKDETGKIVASTFLPSSGDDAGNGGGCIWTMHVLVPSNAQQYAVEGGRRGAVTFSHTQLVSEHWTAALSIGG